MPGAGIGSLVPRTRSSHTSCCKGGCELRVQKGHQNHRVASVPLIPKFASEGAARVCELRNRDTSGTRCSPVRAQAKSGPTRMIGELVFAFILCSGQTFRPNHGVGCSIGPHAPMTVSHLAHLNPEQRRAVEYGGPDFITAGPLLILAGAGSGKTNTLAHRVAHLIVHGIDPRRILLLTFSRRAAGEMMRRVARIVAQLLAEHAPGENAGAITGGPTWSATLHA